jgi:K+-sensing histidine kinase KdpD
MNRMIQDLLDETRIQAGLLTLVPEPLRIEDVITSACEML